MLILVLRVVSSFFEVYAEESEERLESSVCDIGDEEGGSFTLITGAIVMFAVLLSNACLAVWREALGPSA